MKDTKVGEVAEMILEAEVEPEAEATEIKTTTLTQMAPNNYCAQDHEFIISHKWNTVKKWFGDDQAYHLQGSMVSYTTDN